MGVFAHSSSTASRRGTILADALLSTALWLWPTSGWAHANTTDADGDGIIESREPVRFEADETHLGQPCLACTGQRLNDPVQLLESGQGVVGWSMPEVQVMKEHRQGHDPGPTANTRTAESRWPDASCPPGPLTALKSPADWVTPAAARSLVSSKLGPSCQATGSRPREATPLDL